MVRLGPVKSPSFSTALNLFVGLITTIVTMTLSLVDPNDTSIHTLNNLLSNLFLMFPQFCLGRGLCDMAITGSLKAIGEQFSLTIEFSGVFSWDALGKKLVLLAITGVIFFVITLVIEYARYMIKTAWDVGAKHKQALNLMKDSNDTTTDSDVIYEAECAKNIASEMVNDRHAHLINDKEVRKGTIDIQDESTSRLGSSKSSFRGQGTIVAEKPLILHAQAQEIPRNRTPDLSLGELRSMETTRLLDDHEMTQKSQTLSHKPAVTISNMSKLYRNSNPFVRTGNRDVLVWFFLTLNYQINI